MSLSDLSARTARGVMAAALVYEVPATLEGMSQLTEVQMLRLPNFGRKSLNELKAWLNAAGLRPYREPKPRICPHCGQAIR